MIGQMIFFVCLIFFGISGKSNATTLTVSPTRIDLSASGKATTIRVKNTDDTPTTVQVVTKPWIKTTNQAEFVSEIFAVPPIFDLSAGEEQIVRLAARGLSGMTTEQAYLFYIKEVPGELQTEGSALNFSLNIELPLFVTPEDAEPEALWKIDMSDEGVPSIHLVNSGNAHLRIDQFEITNVGDGALLTENTAGAYVLAGAERQWPFETKLDDLKGPVALKAKTSIGPIEAVISLPDH